MGITNWSILLERVPNDTYIAGMRKSSIVRDLAWNTTLGATKEWQNPILTQSPSWSWLSSFQPVRVNAIYVRDDLSPELVSWSVQLEDKSSPFGHVLGGELEFFATIVNSSKVPREIVMGIQISIDCEVFDGQSLRALEFVSDSYHYFYIGEHPEKNAYRSFGLLLQTVGDGTFVRRGLLLVRGVDARASIWLSKEALRMDVRIV
jgi:hypothetical protein